MACAWRFGRPAFACQLHQPLSLDQALARGRVGMHIYKLASCWWGEPAPGVLRQT